MMKLLVTGGMGFIGSNFILGWLRRHPEDVVFNLDALTYAANRYNALGAEGYPNYRFVRGDITDTDLLDRLFDGGFDVVVHFAAESHVDRSIETPSAFIQTNVLGTHTLLHAARKHGVGKFVVVSTDEVYGTLGANGRFTEMTPLAPNSPYSASKAGADLIARAYFETYGYPVIVTRCSNNYGPRQHPEKLIPSIIMRALCDEPVSLYGDGLNVRDWLYVDDHCAALERVVIAGNPGSVYNIGGDNERTNLEVAQLVLRELRCPESLIRFVDDRPGHDRRYAIDASLIARELGWQPVVPFETGLKRTIRWYQERPDYWSMAEEPLTDMRNERQGGRSL